MRPCGNIWDTWKYTRPNGKIWNHVEKNEHIIWKLYMKTHGKVLLDTWTFYMRHGHFIWDTWTLYMRHIDILYEDRWNLIWDTWKFDMRTHGNLIWEHMDILYEDTWKFYMRHMEIWYDDGNFLRAHGNKPYRNMSA